MLGTKITKWENFPHQTMDCDEDIAFLANLSTKALYLHHFFEIHTIDGTG